MCEPILMDFLALFSIKYRKITPKCSRLNVLTIATLKCLSYGVAGKLNNGKTELMENLHLPLCPFMCRKVTMHESVDGKLVWAIMKNWKNGRSSPKTHPRAKLPITNPTKVWVSSFPSVNGYGTLVSAIMKKLEKWL